jgi:hypothetical protein
MVAAPTHHYEKASKEPGVNKFLDRGSPVEDQQMDLGQSARQPIVSPTMDGSRYLTRAASAKEDLA